MCDKPFLLVVEYDSLPPHENRYIQHAGEGPAEEAGRMELATNTNAKSFRIYSLLGEFKRVTKIERVSIKPELVREKSASHLDIG